MPNPINTLDTNQKIAVGKQIIAASRDQNEADSLKADPSGYFGANLPPHDGHEIVPVFNTADRTYFVIPYKDFLMDDGTYPGHPAPYDSGQPGSFIDPDNDPEEAYQFRVGDYVFAGCG